ncbi:hypothetical protein [Bernardetia sp.]|uniref:hypothetical protein n=1 Tax=Bernardetia sp. TaxID=1937974 RepID=UPI0025C297BA|nr:hypothetical protein [Bernardetia sp.]
MVFEIFNVLLPFVSGVICFFVILFVIEDYLSTKYSNKKPVVIMDDELKDINGIEFFVDTLLQSISSEWLKDYSKGKTNSEKEWAKKYWTFGKIESVCLQYAKEHNAFSISVTAKKLGSYTGYQMICLDTMNFGEIEFRVHSFDKHLF